MDGYTVAEAARRLDCSEATIRRQVSAGVIATVPGVRPLRISRNSVERELESKLLDMGVGPFQQGGDDAALLLQIEQLEREVAMLKGALSDIVAAHSATLDTFRRLVEGVVPNN